MKRRVLNYFLIILFVLSRLLYFFLDTGEKNQFGLLLFFSAMVAMAYYLAIQNEWAYLTLLFLNTLSLFFGLLVSPLTLLTVNAVLSYIEIGLAYYLLHLLNPKKYRLPML